MFARTVKMLFAIAIAAVHAASTPVSLSAQGAGAGVTVHEWGTFTTVAGENGRAMAWLPLSGPSDLPCFVHHYQNNRLIKVGPFTRPLDYEAARENLWGRVRMETPVLYFYSPRETSVSVRVQFPQGVMTEWYPQAKVTQAVVSRDILRDRMHTSVIEWPHVTISPDATPTFLTDVAGSHYYAARATDAAPLIVDGHTEKFLFYRGVADFDVPLSAELLPGRAIRIRNTGSEPLPAVILFENRNGAMRYRMLGALQTEMKVHAPTVGVSHAQLRAELEQLLVYAGLYPKEAAAMVDTWRDSWFESGTRVFYVLPPRTIESILPLTIQPTPAQVARVFVGRMDIVTPADQRTVDQAIGRNDVAVLERYGRLLGPISDQILARGANSEQQVRIRTVRNAALARYTSPALTCS